MPRIDGVLISRSFGRYVACAAFGFYALTAAHLWGFDTDYHRDMTAEALKKSKVTWSDTAIHEIQDANLCMDLGVQKRVPKNDEFNEPCTPSPIYCGECQETRPERHFDGENIRKGSAWVRELRDAFITNVNEGHFTQARKVLGFALHALQDFYAHSNWVELGNRKVLFSELLALDSYEARPGAARYPIIMDPLMIEGKTIPVCDKAYVGKVATYTLNQYARARTPEEEALSRGSRPFYLLTTGYFAPTAIDLTPEDKCAHGCCQVIKFNTNKGIGKDNPSHDGFRDASSLALDHSTQFIDSLVDQLNRPPETLQDLYNPRAPGDPIIVPAASRTRFGSVNQGDVYEFRANPGGENLKIVWGRTGLFGLGNPIYCGPEGTPGVNPSNHSLWVTPPLPEANIGALIASIYPAECTPGGQEPCNPIESFLIGTGVRRPMPASGQLFLLVNDGVLANNSGHFKVAVSTVRGESRPIAQVRAGGR
ncbi:MAG: HET-C-related protein [Bryobacteraceae bacterium]